MDDSYIVTGFVLIDDLLRLMGHQDDSRTHISASEIMTVAVVVSKYLHNHHERALSLLQRLGYIPKLSISRFNRRLHNLPEGSLVVADKGYISQNDELMASVEGQVCLIPKYRRNMRGNSQKDAALIREHRLMIESVNSQLEKMDLQHLHARTTEGVALKVLASLTTLALTNVN